MMGASAGFTFLYDGLLSKPEGSEPFAAFNAACTSRAAPLISRVSSNCKTIRELPSVLLDVISVIPAIRPSERSSGVVTAVAMVSGLAPGSDAETRIVGISTRGKGEIGSSRRATVPTSTKATVSKLVATGRAINGAEKFILPRSRMLWLIDCRRH